MDCIPPMRTPFYPFKPVRTLFYPEPMTNMSPQSWVEPDEMSAELKEFVMGKINARAEVCLCLCYRRYLDLDSENEP